MIIIEMKYDPYHMETSLNINHQNINSMPAGYEKISAFVRQRTPIQSWLDPIPYRNWPGLLIAAVGNSNENVVNCSFSGREIDFQDFRTSIERQSKIEINGKYDIEVKFSFSEIYKDADVLEKVKSAYSLVTSTDFKRILDDPLFEISKDSSLYRAYTALPQKYSEAMDGEFRIVFSGTYSSGKSTIINAILGKDILPRRDGTCTSKVFRIQHDDTVEYVKMSCIDKNGAIVVPEKEYDEQSLQNAFEHIFPVDESGRSLSANPPEISQVLISTNVSSLYPANYKKESLKIIIIDTPGTNSGEGNMLQGDQSHVEIAKSVIASNKKEIVVMATNATEDKNESIMTFLNMVDKYDPQQAYDQRFFFVLNKADECSFKKGETWEQKLRGIREYYIGNRNRRIQNPRFFPTSALAALTIRIQDELNFEKIANNYYTFDRKLGRIVPHPQKNHYHFDEYCSTSQEIKNEIAHRIKDINSSNLADYEKQSKEIELHSGIVSLEMAIREYIEKYAFPLKIQALLGTYETIFKETEQLVRIARINFDKSVAAQKNAEVQKSRKEEQQSAEMATKDSLVKAKQAISDKKIKLDIITEEFEKKAIEQQVKIKAEMFRTIEDAKKKASVNPKGASIREDIQKLVNSAQSMCKEEIDNQFTENRNNAMELEKEIINLFSQIKDKIDFGDDFNLGYTTFFKSISTDSITEIQNMGHPDDNPELAYKGLNPWKHLRKLWIDKKIWVDDGIDKVSLDSALREIRNQFNLSIDAIIQEARKKLNNATKQLKNNLELLQKEIDKYAANLFNLKTSIDQIASDETKANLAKRKFEAYEHLLRLIRRNTKFENTTWE